MNTCTHTRAQSSIMGCHSALLQFRVTVLKENETKCEHKYLHNFKQQYKNKQLTCNHQLHHIEQAVAPYFDVGFDTMETADIGMLSQ